MRIATRIAGAAGATALGLVALGGTAFADSADNEGVNLLDDNNASVVPIQACANNVSAVIGLTVPVLSPQQAQCVNAPVVDHPTSIQS